MAPRFRRSRTTRPTLNAPSSLVPRSRWVVAGALCLGLAPVPLADDTPPDTRADDVPWYHRAAPWQAPTTAHRPAAPTPWMAAPTPAAASTAMLGTRVPAFAAAQTNPFGLSDVGYNSAPALADLDGDGDLDALVGEYDGTFNFFENTGTPLAPTFAAPVTSDPFGLTDLGIHSTPTLADLDGDGDLDALVGERHGNLLFFDNTGTPLAPAFAAAQTNPFGLVGGNGNVKPTLADLDGDGDLDVLVGRNSDPIQFFENTGTPLAPAFATLVINPFGLNSVGLIAPVLVDLDGDGDLDAFLGQGGGELRFSENTGTAIAPAFGAVSTLPFGLTNMGSRSTPSLVDLDGDGDLDALVGTHHGNLFFFENTGMVLGAAFAAAQTNPFGLVGGNGNVKPTLADLDGDGDLDVLVGRNTDPIQFFENTGTPLAPAFATLVINPFGLNSVGLIAPVLVDLDGDGDLDAFLGQGGGELRFSENTGTAIAPAFGAVSTLPFGLTNMGSRSTPSLVDLDGDGDLDALVGTHHGNLFFFENTGTPLVPAFAAAQTNPFGLSDVGYNSAPMLADLDGDGDLDVLVGEYDGNFNFFENTGTAIAPAFAAPVTSDPFGLTDLGIHSTPALADLDGDGDLDALVGERHGNLLFFENIGGAFTGTASHSIAGPEGWHFFANPITDETYQDLLSGVWTQGATGSTDPGRDPSLFTYDETAAGVASVGYTAITDLTATMTPGQGFIAYFWEDDDPDTGGTQGGFPKAIDLTGTEQTPTFDFTLTYTDTGSATDDGWNLVGNPSLLTLDWDTGFSRTNVDGTVYLWNPATSAYELWNGATGDLTDGLIAPLQAFFVKANAAAPEMSVDGTSRTTGGVFRKGDTAPAMIDLRVEGDLDGTAVARTAFFMFSDDADAEIDALDGRQLVPLAPTTALFYSETAEEHALQINHLPRPGEAPVSIPLRLEAFVEGTEVGGTFTLTWPRLADVPAGWRVELHDADTGAVLDLRHEDDYTFETQVAGKGATLPTGFAAFADHASPVYAGKGASAARLSLVITAETATATETLDLPETLTLDQNYPNPFNPTTTIRYGLREAGAVRLVVYDLLGREVARLLDGAQQAGWHEVQWSAHTLPSGVYVYRLEAEGRMLSRTLLLVK